MNPAFIRFCGLLFLGEAVWNAHYREYGNMGWCVILAVLVFTYAEVEEIHHEKRDV